jgi:arginine vasopressin receptor 1A
MESSVPEFLNLTTANSTSGSDDRDEALAQVEIALLATMFTVSVLGNIAVLLALYAKSEKKLSRMYYFILHLSVADLCTTFLSTLPQLTWDVTYSFYGGSFLCKIVKYLQTLGLYLSSFILTATALDRYQAVCHPLAHCSRKSRRSRAMVWRAWAFALLFSIPQVSAVYIGLHLPWNFVFYLTD